MEIDLTRDGGLTVVAIDRPASRNVLDPLMLAALTATIDQLATDASVATICLSGAPDAFLLGADLTFFRRCVTTRDMAPLEGFTRQCHALLAAIENCPKRVVAWVRGPALGAGVELALACQAIVAGPGAKFGFPETGLGVYPGMGGTQRAPRRIGVGLAKWMIYSGAIVPAAQAAEIGLVDALCEHREATPALAIASLDAHGSEKRAPTPRTVALSALFENHPLAVLLDPAFPLPTEPQAVRALVQVRGKAPLALRTAEQIIDRGLRLPLAAGLAGELDHLAEIFSTDDARAGLCAAAGQRVEFIGR